MGRIFEVRKHTMFARWDRMAKQFARIAKDINIAVKSGGGDVNSNPALRRAVQNARHVNMPKDKVDAAIKRALGNDSASYEQITVDGVTGTLIQRPSREGEPTTFALLWVKDGIVYAISGRGDKSGQAIEMANSLP